MCRSTAVVWGVVCLVVLTAIPAPVSGPTASPDGHVERDIVDINGTEIPYLTLTDTSYKAQRVTISGDLGASVEISSIGLDTNGISTTIKEEYAAADNKRAYVEQRITTLEQTTDQLIQRQQQAIDRFYSSPTKTNARRLLTELAIIEAEADRIQTTAAAIDQYSRANPNSDNKTWKSLGSRNYHLELQSDQFRGTVRNQLRKDLVSSSADGHRYYVQAAENAVIVSTITHGRTDWFKREAFIPATSGQTDSENLKDNQLIKDEYRIDKGVLNLESSDHLKKFRISFDYYRSEPTDRKVVGFVDLNRSQIVGEYFKFAIKKSYFDQTTLDYSGGTITLWPSMRGGPLQMELENEDETPVNGTVYVNGEQVTTTNDGEATILQPTATGNVTVETENETVSFRPNGTLISDEKGKQATAPDPG